LNRRQDLGGNFRFDWQNSVLAAEVLCDPRRIASFVDL